MQELLFSQPQILPWLSMTVLLAPGVPVQFGNVPGTCCTVGTEMLLLGAGGVTTCAGVVEEGGTAVPVDSCRTAPVAVLQMQDWPFCQPHNLPSASAAVLPLAGVPVQLGVVLGTVCAEGTALSGPELPG
jgi:hypothetical protein